MKESLSAATQVSEQAGWPAPVTGPEMECCTARLQTCRLDIKEHIREKNKKVNPDIQTWELLPLLPTPPHPPLLPHTHTHTQS